MFDRLQKWMAKNKISPLMVLATMNVVLIVGFFVVLLLLIQAQTPSVPQTPQVVVLPNGDVTAVVTPLPTSPEEVGDIQLIVPTLTVGPSPTAPSNPFDVGGTIALALRRQGRTHLYALSPGRTQLTRLTSGAWDDRDPSWSPNGQTIAFASNRSGSWDLFLLDIASGNITRLTNAPGFEANPTWSPDGAFITYEGYADDNFDIFIVSATGGLPIRVTRHPAADFAPAWSPNGRTIAFTSFRGGGIHPDLYTYNLDEPDEIRSVVRLTDTANIAEDEPLWSKDGQLLLYADTNSPLNIVYSLLANAPGASGVEAAQGSFPSWTPDGTGIVTAFNQDNREFVAAAALGSWTGSGTFPAVPVDGTLGAISWSYGLLPGELKGSIAEANAATEPPLWTETISNPSPSADPPFSLVDVPELRAPLPQLSDRANDSFTAFRLRVITEAGWDFLQVIDNAAISVDTPIDPGLPYESWNKAGRAFDVSQAAVNDGWGVMMREEVGNRVYWHLWVRVRQGDGSLGEPLRQVPWDFRTRFSGDPVAYDNGGSYFAEIPKGYFIDFTTIAEDYGWTRVPTSDDWRFFYPGVQYWHYEFRQGLDWVTAMRELYPPEAVATATPFLTPTFTPSPSSSASATGSALPTITYTPSITRTPSNTPTPTVTSTSTTAATRLGLPSFTPSSTLTPSRTPTLSPTATASRTPVPTRTPVLNLSTPTP